MNLLIRSVLLTFVWLGPSVFAARAEINVTEQEARAIASRPTFTFIRW